MLIGVTSESGRFTCGGMAALLLMVGAVVAFPLALDHVGLAPQSQLIVSLARWPLLFAILQRGGIPVDAFTEHVTKDIVQVLQGTIILFVAAEAFFRGPFAKWGLLKRSKV